MNSVNESQINNEKRDSKNERGASMVAVARQTKIGATSEGKSNQGNQPQTKTTA